MRTQPRRLLLIVILVILLLLLLILGIKGWRLYKIVDSLQNHQTEAENMLAGGVTGLEPDRVETLVAGLRSDVVDLKDETASLMFLTPYLGWLPKVGPLITESPELLEIADAGTLAVETVFPSFKPAFGLLQSADTEDYTLSKIVAIIGDAQPSLRQISGELERIETAYDQIENRDQMPWQAQQLFPLVDAYLPSAEDGLLASGLLPELLGNDGRKSYLILVQNEDELRATGGFISGVAVLVVDQGQILQMEFEDSYAVDDIGRLEVYDYPPKPLEEFMGLQYFLFRDSNYWVDFPTTAQAAAELYRLGRPETPEFNGVIAIDQRFLELLVDAIGPIDVPELGKLTGTNVIETIRSAYNSGEDTTDLGEWWLNRKAFMGVIAAEIQNKIFTDPTSIDPVRLLNAMNTAVAGRHLQIWMTSADSAEILSELNWSGEVNFVPNQDHLFVVENNFGYNKVNLVINRSFNYAVTINEDTTVESKLTVRHQHYGDVTSNECTHYNPYDDEQRYQGYIDQCYYNFQRILVPATTQLLSASESAVPAQWMVTGQPWSGETRVVETLADQTSFERFIVVPRGQILDSELIYNPPPTVVTTLADGTQQYKLTAYKQGGLRQEVIRIQVSLPDSAEVISAEPSYANINGSSVTFDAEISADTNFIITYK